MLKLDRLLSIVIMLHSKRVVRADDLARHFGVSHRTIYRDISTLCTAGVPIASEAGVGYSLLRGYHLPPVMFTHQEASALIIGTEFLKNLSSMHELNTSAEEAVAKILSIIPERTKERIHQMQETTAVVIGAGRNEVLLPTMYSDLQEAITNRRVVEILYHSLGKAEPTLRQIEPLATIYYSSNWHCIAYCRLRKEIRDFRMDRFLSVKLTDERFNPHLDFHLVSYLNERFYNENPITVRVLFQNDSVRFTRNRTLYGFIEEVKRDDGVEMTFLAPNIPFIGRWLMAYVDAIHVIEPEDLRVYLRNVCSRALDKL